MQHSDTLQRFMFDNSNVRGIIIHLGNSYQTALGRYDYPAEVGQQLGQALAASALLGSTIKFEGSLIMQIQSSGPINMLVAQSNHEHHLRGLARWQTEELPDNPFGEGRIVITIENEANDERYQGIVGLTDGNLSHAIENYFVQSEQLQTRLWLAADGQQVVGMLLQHLPGQEADEDVWNRIETLGATITDAELLSLPTLEVLQRLFHEEDVRLFESEPVSFRCSCSRDKIVSVIRALGIDEAHEILTEQGNISVGCDFCNQQYEFDSVDVEVMFAATGLPPESNLKH